MAMAMVPGIITASKTYVRDKKKSVSSSRTTIPRIPATAAVDAETGRHVYLAIHEVGTRQGSGWPSSSDLPHGNEVDTSNNVPGPWSHGNFSSSVPLTSNGGHNTATIFTSLITESSPAQLGWTGGGSAGHIDKVTSWTPGQGAIEALLRLAAVEPGVFRCVVRFL